MNYSTEREHKEAKQRFNERVRILHSELRSSFDLLNTNSTSGATCQELSDDDRPILDIINGIERPKQNNCLLVEMNSLSFTTMSKAEVGSVKSNARSVVDYYDLPTPIKLYEKHIVSPPINIMKAINITIRRNFIKPILKNTVFEDPKHFDYVWLPQQHYSWSGVRDIRKCIGIAGKIPVDTILVDHENGKRTELGKTRPFFYPKDLNFHFDSIDFERFNQLKPWEKNV